ncbi:putative kunitz inhibitor STI-like superfamily [Helianthus anomalus]
MYGSCNTIKQLNNMLVYCPSVCSSCKVMCKDIGTYQGNLVLGGDPLLFNFYT